MIRPDKIFIVNNNEDHVGTFFQAAFYDRLAAEAYIADADAADIASQKELAELMEAEVAAGNYPADLYTLHKGEFKSNLDLSIEEYTMM